MRIKHDEVVVIMFFAFVLLVVFTPGVPDELLLLVVLFLDYLNIINIKDIVR